MDTNLIGSVRGLAKHLGRTHSTIDGWLRHDQWPFSPTAPWPKGLRDEMLSWAQEMSASRHDARDRKREDVIAAPGERAFTVADVMNPDHVAGLGLKAIGELRATLTVAEIELLVERLNLGACWVLAGAAVRDGYPEDYSLAMEARPAYYRRLIRAVIDAGEAGHFCILWNVAWASWVRDVSKGKPAWNKLRAKAKEIVNDVRDHVPRLDQMATMKPPVAKSAGHQTRGQCVPR